jgi:protein O-mannosyl-transferase
MKKKYTYLIIIFLTVASLAAFGRIAGNDFINFDDNIYITENNHIKSGINPESIKWAFSAFVSQNWHPITWISLMLDWSLFGANSGGYHLVNLLLHIGSALFLFLFLNKTTNNIWPSAFAAALFALHPLRVESVAWAAERKDVLSMFLGMATLYAYAFYAESHKLSRYFLCLILFLLSLLAKSMLVTLPFVFLLLDYWPLGRWQKEMAAPTGHRFHIFNRLIWEKIPFLLLTIASCIMTVWAQYEIGSVYPPFSERVSNAIVAYAAYLGKTFWPFDLALFYFFIESFPSWQILASCFFLSGITIVVIYAIKKLPFLFVGWFWYLGTLIPVIGLMPTKTLITDHYTYLSSIGIAIVLAWGIPSLIKNEETKRRILFPTGIVSLAVLSVLTWQQCGYWKNSLELWNHSISSTKENALAHNNLALALIEQGKTAEAIDNYNKAIQMKPYFFLFYNYRGDAYAKIGQYQRAIEDYDEAIRLKSDYSDAYSNKGIAYFKLGRHEQAFELFKEAIRQNPYNVKAYNHRGISYVEAGQYNLAIEDFNKAISLQRDDTNTYYNRGNTYLRLGQRQLALEDLNKSIHLNPDYAEAYYLRGAVYFLEGMNEQGCFDEQKACKLGECKLLEWAKNKGYCR